MTRIARRNIRAGFVGLLGLYALVSSPPVRAERVPEGTCGVCAPPHLTCGGLMDEMQTGCDLICGGGAPQNCQFNDPGCGFLHDGWDCIGIFDL